MNVVSANSVGIILINKPRGITSFGVVSRLRRLTGIRRIGHCGTLDPFAEGLLPVCIGKATAAIQFMESYDKTYLVRVVFGQATDTMDLDGTITDTYDFTAEELKKLQADDFYPLRQAVHSLVGSQEQIPPMYSAVKVKGKPLYSYARQGETVARKSRNIQVYSAQILELEAQPQQKLLSAVIRFTCSKGTYIRVLADDLGRKIGYFAHADKLIREQCGPYCLDKALDLEKLFDKSRALPDQAAFRLFLQKEAYLLPIKTALSQLPTFSLKEKEAERLIMGQSIVFDQDSPRALLISPRLALFWRDNLIAVAKSMQTEENKIKLVTERVFVNLEDFRSI